MPADFKSNNMHKNYLSFALSKNHLFPLMSQTDDTLMKIQPFIYSDNPEGRTRLLKDTAGVGALSLCNDYDSKIKNICTTNKITKDELNHARELVLKEIASLHNKDADKVDFVDFSKSFDDEN